MVNPIFVHEAGINFDNDDDDDANVFRYCVFGAILKVWLDLSSIIWTSLIMFSVFATVVLKLTLESLKVEALYLLLAYVFPLTAACMYLLSYYSPAGLQLYGFSSYFCWFSDKSVRNNSVQFWL
jgi:hypothetical protein